MEGVSMDLRQSYQMKKLKNYQVSCQTMFDFEISKEEFVEEFCREDEKKFL
jgi:hypothetical protein